MTQLSKERLEELAAGQSGFNLRTATPEESMEMARLLLAPEAQEPVAFIGKRMLESLCDEGGRTCGRVWRADTDELSGESRIPLYAAPQVAQPVQVPMALCPASLDVLAERQRQRDEEGWSSEHDDEYQNSELADAAACYAIHAHNQGMSTPAHWPWYPSWWKQSGARRDLVKAGALILAEIERIDRAAMLEGKKK